MLYGRLTKTMSYHKKVNAVALLTDDICLDFTEKTGYNKTWTELLS